MNIIELLYNEIINEAFHSTFDVTGRDFEIGQEGEDYFKKVTHSNGYGWKIATQYQETREHIDGTLYSPYTNKSYTVEVKGKKSNVTCKNDILLELRSRGEYFQGWLYGKADYIAFSYENKNQTYPYKNDVFIFINRQKLVELTEKSTGTKWVIENKRLTFKYNPANLVNDTCDAIAPKLYIRGINDPYSVITRLPLTTILGSMQKDKDYYVMKFVERKIKDELKEKGEDINKYKFTSL